MEHYDPQVAKRVWQRVQGGSAPGEELPRILMTEQELMALYQQLAHDLPDKAGLFRQLREETQRHWQCLRGIRFLTVASRPAETPLKVTPAPTESLLRKCYAKNLQAVQFYHANADNSEYGFCYALLAQQKHRHAMTLLELLGAPPKKKSRP